MAFKSIHEATNAIENRRASSRDLVIECLDTIESLNGTYGALITVTAERALQRAEQLDSEMVAHGLRGPLHGIPYVVKDFVDVAGLPTTFGAPQISLKEAGSSADCILALERAGAILVGKANLHEWAFGVTCDNPHYGRVSNPWDTGRIPGGSSGGSAAAVALGMAYFALGTDTGGSVRVPASYCGVAGLKVSNGAVSTRGVFPLSWTLDTVGPLARTARDLEAPLNALLSASYNEKASALLVQDVKNLRVGIFGINGVYEGRLDPAVHSALLEVRDGLKASGASVSTIDLPSLSKLTPVQMAIVLSEAAVVHSGSRRAHREQYGLDLRRSLALGDIVSGGDYIRALRFRTQVLAECLEALRDVDILMSPTTPSRATLHDEGDAYWPEGSSEDILEAAIRYCLPVNQAGLPAVSVPCAVTDGLPIGLQLVGPPNTDRSLVRLASKLEDFFGWGWQAPIVGFG